MATAPLPLVDPKTENMLRARWELRKKTSWVIPSANVVYCNDNNCGNVAIFTRESFESSEEKSFLLIINVSTTYDLSRARIGLVAPDYPQTANNDLRKHKDYSYYDYGYFSGNRYLGSFKPRTTFNFAIDLRKKTQINNQTIRATDDNVARTFDGEMEMRIDIRANRVEFTCPALWRREKVSQYLDYEGKLLLAVCAPAGFSFDLQEIVPRLTLTREIPTGLDLSLEESDPNGMSDVARTRCNEIVEQIRRMSPEDGERYNLLVAGCFGSGKSSLINTFMTLLSDFDDRPKQPALISRKQKHTTRRVSSYQLPGTNIHLIDSIGLVMTGERLNHSDGLLEELFRGNIHAGFDIGNLEQVSGPRVRMERGTPVHAAESDDEEKQEIDVRGYTTADLTLDHRNHGAFVTRAATQYGDDLADVFQDVLDFSANHDDYPLVGVVTKLDVNKKDFSVPSIFTNPDICEEYDSIRREMMLPAVFPARPYTAEDKHRQNAFYNLLAADLMDKMMGEAAQYKERLRAYYADEVEN